LALTFSFQDIDEMEFKMEFNSSSSAILQIIYIELCAAQLAWHLSQILQVPFSFPQSCCADC
jgi:hypothetical protein